MVSWGIARRQCLAPGRRWKPRSVAMVEGSVWTGGLLEGKAVESVISIRVIERAWGVTTEPLATVKRRGEVRSVWKALGLGKEPEA